MELSLLNCFRGPFVVLCHVALLHAALAATDPVEVDALKSFRSNIVKDPLSQLNDWKGDDPCGSSWNGVICKFDNKTQMQHVNEIRLMNIGLMGTLAPDLGNLSRLYILNVMWNNFSGSIPPEIGNLSNLFLLLLNGNNLTGTLPDSLGNLRNLNRIQIDQNKISGPVPKTFANLNNAKHFHMNNNSLSGTIPSEFGSLQKLVHLLLDNNNLNGPLPPEISNISTLLIVQLDNNHFSGGIPSSYSNMFSLTKLSLRNCNLNGSIPDLSKLSDVGVIDLSHNNLSGPLPSGKLSDKLTTIDMSHNQLSGEIPSVYADLPNLQNLVLRNNLLNGTVPQITKGGLILSSTSKLLLDLQYNHFSANNFTNPPSHVVIRLYGNEWCDRNPSSECIPTDTGITGTFQNVSTQNASSSCTEDICDTSRNQELFVFQGGCVCSFPVFVGYRLKSPGFSYFGPYENAFNVYLSGGLKLSTDQVKVKNYTWEPGPRLHMNLNLFPAHNMTREFNSSEWRRLYDLFTNWQIPDNNTFGPYEVLSFPIQFPYSETFNTGSSRGLTGGAIAGIAVGSAALTAIVAAIFVIAYVRKQHYIASTTRKRGRNVRNEKIKVFGVKDFTFEEMSLATNNFSSSMQVGQGGYGKVYKGILADGQVVAIKRAQEGSLQGSKEFYTEIELLSRVHHRNLVSLVGYCDDEGEQMLVYEFMANGTLRDHLSSNAKWPFDFQSRLQIALGSARGILYLHTEANPPIFHRDIKASNILLDEKNRAKVADFGLSRLAPVPDVEGVVPGHVSTVVKGTPGYLDPEYFLTHKLTDKSDVYSFGVVLLEIITGMQPISHGKNIVREVNIAYEAGMVLSVVDPRMGSYASEALEPLVRLAVACCKDDPDARPSMAEVVKDLEDILRVTPWADSLNSFESSEVELKDMKKERNQISSNPYISSDMDGDLMSRTIPNIAPR